MGENRILNDETKPLETDTLEEKKFFGLTLEDCFRSIVESRSVEFELENLNNILKRDLQVNFYYLQPKLKYVMPYMLVHFIKCWPGWQKSNQYVNKQISFNNWFIKFKEYLVFKINYLIKNDYQKVLNMLKANPPPDDNVVKRKHNSTQVSVPVEKGIAPYCIQISGSPKILNSLIFFEGQDDGIILKEYNSTPFADNLTTKQLLNWPFVEIEFVSKEIHFKRKNVHDFKRCIMLTNDKLTLKNVESVIEEVNIVDKTLNRSVYTLNVLREYCDTYVEVLKRHQKIAEITDDYIVEVKTIFNEFLTDIEELNMNSMATNTSVVFNLGKFNYARNKALRSSNHTVSFGESITPRVDVTLFSFTGLKNENSDVPFQELQNLLDSTDKEFIQGYLPTLQFGCTYCNTRYVSKVYLLSHFKEEHCMEQPILCFGCKSQMDVASVCDNRWSHQCPNKINTEETAN